jgi:phosphoglucosamine mutase
MILDETGRGRWRPDHGAARRPLGRGGAAAGGALVATVMSNLGLERFLRRGLRLERTAVGDRYVVERMREGGFNLGGEQSGIS